MAAGTRIAERQGHRMRHLIQANADRRPLPERFAAGQTFAQFLEGAENMREFWRAASARASVDGLLVERAEAIGGAWRLLVLNADWCGDSVNSIPYVARLAEKAANLELRLLDRDENLDLMDAHLTRGSRSIPKVIVFDSAFRECGSWGPRPTELQRWVITRGLALARSDRYRETRTWYARDQGRTTIEEVVSVLESCARREMGS